MFADGPFSSLTFSTESQYVIFIDIRNVKLTTKVTNSNDGKTISIDVNKDKPILRTRVVVSEKVKTIELSKNNYKIRTKVEKARTIKTGVNMIEESEKPVIMENQNEF